MNVSIDTHAAQAERIRLLRKMSGLSQFELASKTGINNSVLSSYERGHRRPSVAHMEAIEKACTPLAKARAEKFLQQEHKQ